MKVSSLAAPKVVILTTFGAASDEDFIKMKTFSFQCISYRNISSELAVCNVYIDNSDLYSSYYLSISSTEWL